MPTKESNNLLPETVMSYLQSSMDREEELDPAIVLFKTSIDEHERM